jgi:outer membrane protein, multidrug efflux system
MISNYLNSYVSKMAISVFRPLFIAASASVLVACSITMPPERVAATLPTQWQAPLPHQGNLTELTQWWQQQGDSVLVELMEAAQKVSPTLASAVSRVESARTNQVAAGAVLLPQVQASVGGQRGVSQPAVPVATSLQTSVQAAWEIDLVGANRAVNRAAQAQLEGVQAQWHDARVVVAAEVAQVYYGWQTCRQLLDVARQDALSRIQTADSSAAGVQAGLIVPTVAALARASAAEARARENQQATVCEAQLKALVALTGLDESVLRNKLQATLLQPLKGFTFDRIPAQTIAQRPDIFAAERDVILASAQVGSAKAQRYPRLTLAGSIGALRYNSMGVETNLDTWSFGPLAVTVPLFDGGQRRANVTLAETRYAEAVTVYRAQVRNAVREVEEAMLNLQSNHFRTQEAQIATQGYSEYLQATTTRHAQGLASLMELEEARRVALAAQSALLSLDLETKRAWIALYRAVGGGFQPHNSPN